MKSRLGLCQTHLKIMVHKMLIEFEPEEYDVITTRAKDEQTSRRGWVMRVVREALQKGVPAPIPVNEVWVFKMKAGGFKRSEGKDLAEAWLNLGYTMADIELIDERLLEKEAIEAGWGAVKGPPMVVADQDVGLPFGK